MRILLKQYRNEPNAGDFAGAAIVRALTGLEIDPIGEPPCGRPNLMALGSILHWADTHSIVWGAGFISSTIGLPHRPKRIAAVRGPLTRDRLTAFGVGAPDVLGDPGVFVPDLFPKAETSADVGIVPHLVDANEPFVHRARAAGADVLDVQGPLDVFLSRLSACRRIVSSSLHGVIFAHAYGIPAVWIELSDRVHGAGFKFFDYYASVGVAAADVRRALPSESLDAVARDCALPPEWIDTASLRQALLDVLPDLGEAS